MKETETRFIPSDNRKRGHAIDDVVGTTVSPQKGAPATKNNGASANSPVAQVGFPRFMRQDQTRCRIRTARSVQKRCRVTV